MGGITVVSLFLYVTQRLFLLYSAMVCINDSGGQINDKKNGNQKLDVTGDQT